MPNRTIKESICGSETLEKLSAEEEVFFYRLITVCDDFGLMDARPSILLGRCFPLRIGRLSVSKIETWLNKLAEPDIGLILLYQVEGKQYLKVTSWEEHQQKRAKYPKYPQPPEDANTCKQLIAGDSNCPPSTNNELRVTSNDSVPSDAIKPAKQKYGEFVTLLPEEYEKLCSDYGERMTNVLIETLDNYKGAHGKRYKSDYRAILTWVVDKVGATKVPTAATNDEDPKTLATRCMTDHAGTVCPAKEESRLIHDFCELCTYGQEVVSNGMFKEAETG